MDYAWEKLHTAVLGIARSDDSLQVRLAYAYIGGLINIRPEETLPENLRPNMAEIHAAFRTHEAKGDEGGAMASALAMSDEDARATIEKIVILYDEIAQRSPFRR
ncbi:hypothetical protein [Methylobacterium aquaticum]|uniref:hypothetical protein n=1 Tax=Methylobacterium aquaticum TaxID=270351 RepID=UPI0019317AEC|nr:hypothetical protein [Methylobacterium aquaticum]QRE78246.1 hypothetical protein F1D61_32995 [Methylobacterium aquaticum]QRE78266.1 hypothetical protein F1D61_33105 [Methylobacterium aquaticum]